MKKIVAIISENAKKQGVRAFIVGGVTRDLILKRKINDLDFLIEGNGIEFAKNAGFKIHSIHKDFGTAKVEIEGKEIDIASTREETYSAPGALPLIIKTGVKIEDDLKRRDFTINSIAKDITTNEIIDPFFGQKDIKRGILRILHKKSFIDDPTRILRGLDFKYRLGFEFELNTLSLLKNTPKNYDNSALSIDRIYLTLNKIFKNENAKNILQDILDFEIYKIWMKKTDLKDVNTLYSAAEIFNADKSKLFIAALESIPYIKAPLRDDFEIYEFFKKFNNVQLALYYFKTGDKNAVKYLKIKDIKPILNGHDLIEAGFSRGEKIGQALNLILKEKILNPNLLNSKDEELSFLNFRFFDK